MTNILLIWLILSLILMLAFFYACGEYERRMDAENHGPKGTTWMLWQLGHFEASGGVEVESYAARPDDGKSLRRQATGATPGPLASYLSESEASAERSSVATMEQPVAPVSLLNGPQIPVSGVGLRAIHKARCGADKGALASFSLLTLNPRLFV